MQVRIGKLGYHTSLASPWEMLMPCRANNLTLAILKGIEPTTSLWHHEQIIEARYLRKKATSNSHITYEFIIERINIIEKNYIKNIFFHIVKEKNLNYKNFLVSLILHDPWTRIMVIKG